MNLLQFEELENIEGTKNKILVLQKLLRDGDNEKLVRMAFNDNNYFVGDKTFFNALQKNSNYDINKFKHVSDWLFWTEYYPMANGQIYTFDDFEQFCNNLSRKNLESQIYNFFAQCSQLQKKWFSRVMLKDLRCGVQLKSVNKALKKISKSPIVKFEVQLCGSLPTYEEWTEYPSFAAIKYDGFRCVVKKKENEITMTSRQGKNVSGYLPELVNEFKKIQGDFILDGEVMADNFSSIQKRIGRKDGNLNFVENLHYRVFDILERKMYNIDEQNEEFYDRPQLSRYIELDLFMNYYVFGNINAEITQDNLVNSKRLIRLEDRYFIKNKHELQYLYNIIKNMGMEGLVLKHRDAVYVFGGRKNWFKLKPHKESTLEVVGVERGTGKHHNVMGSLICQDKTGRIKVSVGSGFIDTYREQFFNNPPKFIDVMYNEITKDKNGQYSLRFPRFLKVRNDKVEADDLFN